MVRVMAVVGYSPGEVRRPEEGVGDESYDVTDQTTVGKGAMAGFVTDDPDPGEDEALEPPAVGSG